MDEELFLPVLSHFENGNFWTASGGALRYKVVPDTGESPRLTAEVWEGPWRYQDSTVEETKEFPLSEEGLEELRGWLARWRTEMNARPKKTLPRAGFRGHAPGAPGSCPACSIRLPQSENPPLAAINTAIPTFRVFPVTVTGIISIHFR